MRRQRNMVQIEEQIKTPCKELNEMEISNLSDEEFKTLVIRSSRKLGLQKHKKDSVRNKGYTD